MITPTDIPFYTIFRACSTDDITSSAKQCTVIVRLYVYICRAKAQQSRLDHQFTSFGIVHFWMMIFHSKMDDENHPLFGKLFRTKTPYNESEMDISSV